MKNSTRVIFFFFWLFQAALLLGQDAEIVGFWKSMSDSTGKPESIIAVYEYQNRYYGRIILTYDDTGKIEDTLYAPKNRAPGVKGQPFYAGMDILWNLNKSGQKYKNGEIIDPEKGRIYGAELWRDGKDLVVRGEFLFFGRNAKWPPAKEEDFPPDFKKPDLNKLTPVIPRVK